MKRILIAAILLIGLSCYGQTNYYKLFNDSIYNQKDFDLRLKSTIKTLPTGFTLIPTIYHKQEVKDSVINYISFRTLRTNQKSKQSKVEIVFRQDTLFLLLDKKLPDFRLKDLNGKEFKSSQLIGKPTLINFWSIQCSPCIAEFPQLNKLKEKYGDKVNFIAISENSREQVLELLKQKPFNFYQLVDGYDYKTNTLKMSSIPRNIFIDKNGYIRVLKEGLPYETDEKSGQSEIISNLIFEKILDKIIKL
jgi:cytochrome c biogenesis protein CcmG, thiol:disulfide interchange protein DsbE